MDLLFTDKCTPVDRYDDQQVFKRKNLRQGSTACFSGGPPDCLEKAEAGWPRASFCVCSPAWGSKVGGSHVWLGGCKDGKSSFTTCIPLSRELSAWSCQCGSGFFCLLPNQGCGAEKGIAHLPSRQPGASAALRYSHRAVPKVNPHLTAMSADLYLS